LSGAPDRKVAASRGSTPGPPEPQSPKMSVSASSTGCSSFASSRAAEALRIDHGRLFDKDVRVAAVKSEISSRMRRISSRSASSAATRRTSSRIADRARLRAAASRRAVRTASESVKPPARRRPAPARRRARSWRPAARSMSPSRSQPTSSPTSPATRSEQKRLCKAVAKPPYAATCRRKGRTRAETRVANQGRSV